MVEDWSREYRGGLRRLELAKGHPQVKSRFHGLLDELAAEREAMLALMERPAWKTIKLGTHDSHQALRQALVDGGFRIGSWGDDILKRISVATKPNRVDLVLTTVAELGFPNGARWSEVYGKILSLGLRLCPAEAGPQLRFQYPDQPMGEWVLIAMEPITDSDGYPHVFSVARDGRGRWLGAPYGRSGHFVLGDHRWVFCRK